MSGRVSTALFLRLVKLASALGALALLGAGAGTAFLWYARSAPVSLPAPTGAYAVGRVAYDWVDEARTETLTDEAGRKRELIALVWYPAASSADARPAPYLPTAWAQAREEDWGIWRILQQSPMSVQTHAFEGVALANAQAAYPVLFFQPGLGPIAPDYATIAEELASHGYVVVATTPTYSASVVVFADGRVAHATRRGNPPDDLAPDALTHFLNDLIDVWADDVVFSLNQAERLNADATSPFFRRLDLTRVGVFGHSFGGATAAQVCLRDARCKAGANLDGYPFGDVAQRGVSQPFMFIWSENEAHDALADQAARDTQAILARTPHGYQLTIKGARHFNFADLAVQFSPFLELRGALGAIDGARGLRITNTYLLAFFDQYLNRADSTLLGGASPDYPEVQFESQAVN